MMRRISILLMALGFCAAGAPRDRIRAPIDARRQHALTGNVHRLAQPQFDRGAVDPQTAIQDVLMIFKLTAAQRADLDTLLVDQQNPSSPQYHKWLTPEEFGERFGLSAGDYAKVVAWLKSEGLAVNPMARARNWMSFSGTASQLSKTLHTSFHRFQVDGETHIANTTDPSIPEAMADVVAGLIGLDDFGLKPLARPVPAALGSTGHALSPRDYATIYNIAPLYQAGVDGTGVSIAIVGESDFDINDYRAFRNAFHLPQNDPKVIFYAGTDPGNRGGGLEDEAVLDLEWAGAIAPGATLYYFNGPNAYDAIAYAINSNLAQVLSASYVGCELYFTQDYYRAVFQQGSAQGMTFLNSSGDAGPAGCNSHGGDLFGTRGRIVEFPSVLPEVTSVGGTEFAEGSGNYWSAAGDALSYIPEIPWNDTGLDGLNATGGGASRYTPKPAWQNGPGVPNDHARDVPDISLSASLHDPYVTFIHGHITQDGGTSASSPSMAGIVALLNHYQVKNGYQQRPGLGNINPQLYRMAQVVPNAFHDLTSGDNIVPCQQGSPDCTGGSYGFAAGAGYDQATGLGSVDANVLVTQWNTAGAGVTVTAQPASGTVTVNDPIAVSVTVAPASGAGTPSGVVVFNANGVTLGSVTLVPSGGSATANINLPAYLLGAGQFNVTALYSGDASFSPGSSSFPIQVTTPSGVAAISVSAPAIVQPTVTSTQSLEWQFAVTFRESGGVPASITGLMIDNAAQPLALLGSTAIAASSSMDVSFTFTDLGAPVTRTISFSGTDRAGNSWSRSVSILFGSLYPYRHFNLTATPSTVRQNPNADPSCQWQVQLNADEMGGYPIVITDLMVDGASQASQIASIFGSTRMDAWQTMTGTLCFSSAGSGAHTIGMNLSGATNQVAISLTGPAENPGSLSATPANVALVDGGDGTARATLSINLSDASQTWTASVFPGNQTTSWLKLSQAAGTGSGQFTLQANGNGFGPGAYPALLVIQSANAVPQSITIPVMFTLGPNASGMSIGAVANAFSYQPTASPGMLMSIFGSQLANSNASAGADTVFSLAGVTATVNNIPAPILYVSSGLINVQVPYTAGAGPAVLGINNNGQIAGFEFQIAASAPGIFADGNGNVLPAVAVAAGSSATVSITGAGDVSPVFPINIAAPPFFTSPQGPILPLTVTVGGVPSLIASTHLSGGAVQVTFVVPSSVPSGPQPVVVTVGGVASPPANLNIK